MNDRLQVRHLGVVDYSEAYGVQQRVHARVVDGTTADTLLLLEHPSVYTAGRRTEPWERPTDPTVPVLDVDRGGKITWHGPGQLVGYPIVRLADSIDVVGYVRRLEAALIECCAELGLSTRAVAGRSGVWTTDGQRKVAAIGVRVSRGVTMHGFALNANPDLSHFDRIVACGLADAGVTSLSVELGRQVVVADVLPVVQARVDTSLAGLPMALR